MRMPVDVQGALSLDGPSGRRVTLQAAGPQLYVAAPGWGELGQFGPRSLVSKHRALKAAITALNKLGLTLDVEVAGHRALGLGIGVKTTLFARLIGLTSADIRLATIVRLLR